MQISQGITQSPQAAKLFIAQTKGSKANPATALGGDAPINPSLGGPSQPLPGSIDLEAFFQAWGTANEQFDVSKDGVVDGKDLAIFLGAAEAQPPVSPEEVLQSWGQPGGGGDVNGDGVVDGTDLALALGNVKPSAEQELAAGVQKAWGTSDGQYDLNKDGTVDAADLAIALSGTATAVKQPAQEVQLPATKPSEGELSSAARNVADAVMAARDGDRNGLISTRDLPSAARFLGEADADESRTLSRDELATRLTSLFAKAAEEQPSTDANRLAAQWTQRLLRPSDLRGPVARNAYLDSVGGSSGLSGRLFQQLAANGFSHAPPSNLADIVGGVARTPAERTAIMQGLSRRYPNGLGVNARA